MTDVVLAVSGPDGVEIKGDPAKVKHSHKVTFTIKVDSPAANETYKATLKHGDETVFSKKSMDDPQNGVPHEVKSVTKDVDGGEWVATVEDGAGNEVGSATRSLEVEAEPASPGGPPKPPKPPGEYDPKFTGWSVGIALVSSLLLIVGLAVPVSRRKMSDVPVVWILAFGLFFLGVLIAAGGIVLVAIEVRGKLVAVKSADGLTAREASLDPEKAAKLVEAIAKLRGSTAVLLLAAVCIISAAWIGYGSTRPNSPATPTTVTPTTSVAPPTT